MVSFIFEFVGTVSWVLGAGKTPGLGYDVIAVSVGANSETWVGEPAMAAGVLGRGKLMSSNSPVGPDVLILGETRMLDKFVSTP